jgi:hypothetical protein
VRRTKASQYRKASECLLGSAKELGLFLGGLETSMTEFGRGVDKLEVDLLAGIAAGLRDAGLAKGDHTLLGTDNAALDHDVILVHNTVVREATQGTDGLVGQVVGGLGVEVHAAIFVLTFATHLVDLLVDLGTVMVTILTSASNGVFYPGRVPCANTGDLTQTTVSLTGKAGDAPTSDDTFESVTLGCTNGVDHLVHGEHGTHRHHALKQLVTEVCLLCDSSTVDLDLHQVGLLLAKVDLLDVGVSQHTHDGTELLDALQLRVFAVSTLSFVLGKTVSVLGERLLLGVVPVLVESSLDLLIQLLSPDSCKGSQSLGGFDVTHETNDAHRRGLNDGHSLDNFLFVDLGSGFVGLTKDVSHTGLVAHEGSEVAWLGSIVPRELSDASSVVGGSFTGEESEGSVARGFKLTV